MFFYISFLRAPPVSSRPHSPILITPQISNDLRTEPFPKEQDIYYTWIRNGAQQQTTPTKWTTYRQTTSYKPIPIPLPPQVREGQRWSLILSAQTQSITIPYPNYVALGTSAVGDTPFSVTSKPILFTSKAKNDESRKQEMIERVYLVPHSLVDQQLQQAKVRFTERTSFDLDKKIWDSGIGLSSWLCQLGTNSTTNDLLSLIKNALFSRKNALHALELGSGLGLVSVTLAILRAFHCNKVPEETAGLENPTANDIGVHDHHDHILATDVQSAMPLLVENIDRNTQWYNYKSESSTSCSGIAPVPLVLDWQDERLPHDVEQLGHIDVILMADVLYNTSAFPSLSRTLSKLIALNANNASKPPLIILGYKERDQAERSFWQIASEIGIDFEMVGERKGWRSDDQEGQSVEVWIGRVKNQETIVSETQ